MSAADRTVSYRQFREEPYGRMVKALLEIKGGPLQKQFLEAVRDRGLFLDYMSSVPLDGIREVPLWDDPISERDFRTLPPDLELRLYRRWGSLSPEAARRPGFWAHVTIRHIEAGRISSTHLAATTTLTRESAIDQVLADATATRIDACVRTVLRRMGGLPQARGHRSVYVDCMFARAWWRERMVDEATSELANQVRALFRMRGKSLWEEVVSRLIAKVGTSVFGSLDAPSEVRGAFFLALARRAAENPQSPLTQSQQITRVCAQLAIYHATPGLGPAADTELATILTAIIEARDSS